MRGERAGYLSRKRAGVRFIPACAGNARHCPSRRPGPTVHPRMRGEREESGTQFENVPGSSPHARGTLHSVEGLGKDCRFIPACAGNAISASTVRQVAAVHPRMRGERARSAGGRAALGGSSPHARGTLPQRLILAAVERFIPACAGNAAFDYLIQRQAAVHPRMRGERHRARF